MKRAISHVAVALCLILAASSVQAKKPKPTDPGPLRDVKAIQLDATVVPNPDKVKEEGAPNLIQDSLRNAFRLADIAIADSAPIHAHIILDEFTSGSAAKRFLVGLGAGRSTITCHLVLQDAHGKELKNVNIHVRGNLIFSPYQGNNTQRQQAVNSFDQRLLEEIEKMK